MRCVPQVSYWVRESDWLRVAGSGLLGALRAGAWIETRIMVSSIGLAVPEPRMRLGEDANAS